MGRYDAKGKAPEEELTPGAQPTSGGRNLANEGAGRKRRVFSLPPFSAHEVRAAGSPPSKEWSRLCCFLASLG